MDIVNISSTTNEIDGIPYWIIPGKKDDEGRIYTVSFIYRDKMYDIELEPDERPSGSMSSINLIKLNQRIARKMKPYLENHS